MFCIKFDKCLDIGDNFGLTIVLDRLSFYFWCFT